MSVGWQVSTRENLTLLCVQSNEQLVDTTVAEDTPAL